MTSASTARNSPQVPQTTGDTQFNVRDAALRGASTAFSKPPVKPKPQVNTYTGGSNGALLAATKVGSRTPQSSTLSPLRRDWTGGSTASRPSPSPMQLPSKSNSSSTLGVPEDFLSDRTASPSNIAAKLAAARFSPMKPLPQASNNTVASERDPNERDILPPAGSVRQVLSRLDSRGSAQPTSSARGGNGFSSFATTAATSAADNKPTDDTPIPPTTSLVKMFEQRRPKTPTNPPVEPLQAIQRSPPPVKSPKPLRKINLPPEPPEDVFLQRVKTRTPPPVKPKPKPLLEEPSVMDGSVERARFANLRKDSLGTPPIRQKPAQLTAIKTTMARPQPPPKKGSRQSRPKSEDVSRSMSLPRRFSTSRSMASNDDPSSPASFKSAREEQEQELEEKPKPSLPPPRRSTKAKTEAVQPKPAPKVPEPRKPDQMTTPLRIPEKFPPRPSTSGLGSSPGSDTMYHSNYQRESVKKISKHMTGESLSNAIVGAALASSRNASPKPPPTANPPLPTRKHHHHHPFHLDRSPSPPKSAGKMRTTLRKDPSSSSDEDESEKYRKKGTRVMGMRKKHPNKHHEGTRKRWRDTITERERKRYEGVWAANKALYIQPLSYPPPEGDLAQDVCNLVTKEIWMRSRLAEDVLEEVWDLVDSRRLGRLRREEFVVGLWLIDQRLKGRKLPIRVSESVWGSVRGVGGVKVRVAQK